MRTLKFRAWDGNKMFPVDVMALSECTWDCPDHGKRGVSLAYQPSIKVMQFTGMADMHGTDIYDGDIVLCWSGKPEDYLDYRELEGVVNYAAPYWQVGDNYLAWNAEFVEVIGNIYENGDPHGS